MKRYKKRFIEVQAFGLPISIKKRYKQFTIDIGNGHKLKIKMSKKTWKSQFVGWNIDINGERYFKNLLDQQKALDDAVASYIKKLN